MVGNDVHNPEAIVRRLREQCLAGAVRITLHAHQEMVEEDFLLKDLCDVLTAPTVLENYPDHRRGPCCLVCGTTEAGRHAHVVCTTSLEAAIIITVYEPLPPKWPTPFERGTRR